MVRHAKNLPAMGLAPALMIALAQLVLAPSRASAGCGDYVMVGGHGRAHSQAQVDPRRAPDLERIPGAPVENRPCSGPFCSRDIPRPMGAPSEPAKIVVRNWGILAAVRMPPPIEARAVTAQDDTLTAAAPAASIYRPPR